MTAPRFLLAFTAGALAAGCASGGDASSASDGWPFDGGQGSPESAAAEEAATEPAGEGGAGDESVSEAGPVGTSPDAGAAASDGSTGCQYTTVFEQMGPVLGIGNDVTKVYYWKTEPLPGKGFYCMKVEFDMQTANTLAGLGGPGVGCPIYTLVTGIHGNGSSPQSQQKLLAGALFKFVDLSCNPGAHRVELDTSWKSLVTQGPWNLGEPYHFIVEIKPYTSTVTLMQNGAIVGSVMSADITGAKVADTMDPRVDFGDPTQGGGSNWPNYGAVYSNLVISADVAP